jgi:HAD superfamily hydrolase (TIGR01549 family)
MPYSHGVLFDVGYGLCDEWPRCLAALQWLGDYLNAHGLHTTLPQLQSLYKQACFAPRRELGSLMVQVSLLAGADEKLAHEQRQHMPWDAHPMHPYPEAIDALKILRDAGLRIGVLANQPASAADDLRRAGVTPYLDGIWLSDVVGLHKPDPAFFQLAADAWQLPLANIAYIGDRPDNDVAPVNRLGMHSVRLLVGPHIDQPARTPDEHADYQAADLLDAARHLVAWADGAAA